MLASYTTYDYVNNAVSESTASIEAWASNRFASISLTARVGSIEGALILTSDASGIGYLNTAFSNFDRFGRASLYGSTSASISGGTVYIQGKAVYWSNGYLRGQ